ncbi:MAG: hypothetical protein ACYTKD_22390 [Planctomycetota bacterium]|jgi:hypothetical protein
MSRLSAFAKGRGAPAVALFGAAAVLAGCGGTRTAGGPLFLEMVEYDHYFFDDLASTEGRSEAVKEEIERLATTSWRAARANIIEAGKDAIPRLIANMDRPELTHIPLRPVPGPTMPEARPTWTLGQVSYSVLRDLVGDYGNFKGAKLPPPEKAVWEGWWQKNKKGFVAYTKEGTIPPHVRKQKEAIVTEIEDRYRSVEPALAKMLEKRAAREQAKEQALREREQRLLEKKRQVDLKRAERAELAAEKLRKATEAREAREAEAAAPAVEENGAAREVEEGADEAAPE